MLGLRDTPTAHTNLNPLREGFFMRRDRGSGIWFSEAVKKFKGFTHTQYTSGPAAPVAFSRLELFSTR